MMIIKAVIRREWKELRSSRMLLLSTFLPPLLLLAVGLVTVILIPQQSDSSKSIKPLLQMANPIMQLGGLSDQLIMAKFYMSMFLLLPAIIPLMIASNSIIGEKQTGSLEAVLATPITVKQLLVGKIFASVIPATVLTWAVQVIFWSSAILPNMNEGNQAFFSAAWMVLMFLMVPLICTVSVGLGVIVSSRVNDSKAAQQISVVVVLPVLAFAFGQVIFINMLNNWLIYALTLLVAAIAAWGAISLSVGLFQRRSIISSWK